MNKPAALAAVLFWLLHTATYLPSPASSDVQWMIDLTRPRQGDKPDLVAQGNLLDSKQDEYNVSSGEDVGVFSVSGRTSGSLRVGKCLAPRIVITCESNATQPAILSRVSLRFVVIFSTGCYISLAQLSVGGAAELVRIAAEHLSTVSGRRR